MQIHRWHLGQLLNWSLQCDACLSVIKQSQPIIKQPNINNCNRSKYSTTVIRRGNHTMSGSTGEFLAYRLFFFTVIYCLLKGNMLGFVYNRWSHWHQLRCFFKWFGVFIYKFVLEFWSICSFHGCAHIWGPLVVPPHYSNCQERLYFLRVEQLGQEAAGVFWEFPHLLHHSVVRGLGCTLQT